MKVDLNGKVAIVTGGGGAIGSAMCIRLAENGAKPPRLPWMFPSRKARGI